MQLSPVALFITGPSGCGKTTLAQAWVRHALGRGQSWTLLDKDIVGALYGPRLLTELGADPHDRDSPVYKQEVRNLDYGTTLRLAAEQLALGGSVVLPGPWTQELVDGRVFEPTRLGLPEGVRCVALWLTLAEAERHRRIARRGHAQDGWKLRHWDSYANGAAPTPPTFGSRRPIEIDAQLPMPELLEQVRFAVDAAQP